MLLMVGSYQDPLMPELYVIVPHQQKAKSKVFTHVRTLCIVSKYFKNNLMNLNKVYRK